MGINSILNFFKLDEESLEEDGYYSEDYDEPYEDPEPPVKKSSRSAASDRSAEDTAKQRGFLGSKPKVVPMGGRAMLEVSIIKPTTFEDSQEICNMLLTGKPVVVNLEGFDPNDAQRIMDFISGCIYAIKGKYHQISKYIFIFSPESVDISGDSLSMEGGMAKMPTINREF